MSDNPNPNPTDESKKSDDGQQAAQPTDPKPTPPKTDQTDDKTDWRAEAKKWEQRAKENVDKARRLDKIEDANKSETQRLTEALTAAQQQAEKAQADALRFRIAAKHNITDADADLFLTGSDADTLERQAARLAEQITKGQPPRGYVPGEGTSPTRSPALNSTGLEDAIKSKLGIA